MGARMSTKRALKKRRTHLSSVAGREHAMLLVNKRNSHFQKRLFGALDGAFRDSEYVYAKVRIRHKYSWCRARREAVYLSWWRHAPGARAAAVPQTLCRFSRFSSRLLSFFFFFCRSEVSIRTMLRLRGF